MLLPTKLQQITENNLHVQVKCSAGYFCTGGSDSATPQSVEENAPNGKCPKVGRLGSPPSPKIV